METVVAREATEQRQRDPRYRERRVPLSKEMRIQPSGIVDGMGVRAEVGRSRLAGLVGTQR